MDISLFDVDNRTHPTCRVTSVDNGGDGIENRWIQCIDRLDGRRSGGIRTRGGDGSSFVKELPPTVVIGDTDADTIPPSDEDIGHTISLGTDHSHGSWQKSFHERDRQWGGVDVW